MLRRYNILFSNKFFHSDVICLKFYSNYYFRDEKQCLYLKKSFKFFLGDVFFYLLDINRSKPLKNKLLRILNENFIIKKLWPDDVQKMNEIDRPQKILKHILNKVSVFYHV